MGDPFFEAKEVTKVFGGLVALDRFNCTIEKGEIRAIIGPNGAGKTTFFNLVSGLIPLTLGEVRFKGKRIDRLLPHLIAQMGISRTFQNVQVFGEMSVLENVMVGRHLRTRSEILRSALKTPGTRREESEVLKKSMEILKFVGLESKAYLQSSHLPFGQQRLLEIARALATEPELLLLDEPAAGLNIRETEMIAQLIFRMRERGITIFLVEHDMNLVMGVSDRVTVLNYGRKIAEGSPREVQRNREVIAAYLGEENIDAQSEEP